MRERRREGKRDETQRVRVEEDRERHRESKRVRKRIIPVKFMGDKEPSQ